MIKTRPHNRRLAQWLLISFIETLCSFYIFVLVDNLVYKKTKPKGTCATYTVAGEVKRALIAAGFSLEKVPGCGGKKSVLKGVKL